MIRRATRIAASLADGDHVHDLVEGAVAGIRDMTSARRIQDEVTNGPRMPDIPVTVLTCMQTDSTPGMSDDDKRAFNKIKLDAHAAFSKSLPQGEHRVLEDAGHLLY